jgi:hypothetical protein
MPSAARVQASAGAGVWASIPNKATRGKTSALNRQRKLERVREGKAHAALVFRSVGHGLVGGSLPGVSPSVRDVGLD